MKNIILIPFTLLLFACSGQESLQIVIDDKHNHATGDGSPENYEIVSTQELTLDASSYSFGYPDDTNDVSIEIFQVIIGENVYQGTWEDDNVVSISKDNLKLIMGNTKFQGFKAGQKIAIGLGQNNLDAEQNVSSIMIVYALMIDVTK